MKIKITELAITQIKKRKENIKNDCVPIITYFEKTYDSVYTEVNNMNFEVVHDSYWGLGWRLKEQIKNERIEQINGIEIIFDSANKKPPTSEVFIDYDGDFHVLFK